MSGSWVTAWSSPGPCCWHCYWCWGTSDSSETSSNQLSMVKNIYLDTKINLLWCQGAEIHLEVVLDPVVGIVVDVGVHVTVLKPVLINSAWSKTYILLVLSLYKRSYFPCRGLARCLYSAECIRNLQLEVLKLFKMTKIIVISNQINPSYFILFEL